MEDSMLYFLIVAIVFFVLLHYSVKYFNDKNWLVRQLKRKGAKSISDFSDGEIGFVCGDIRLGEFPVQSPLSGVSCAFYLIEVIHDDSDDERTVSIDRVGTNLLISDGSGVALIKLKNATLYLKMANSYQTEKYFFPDIQLDEYLVKQGISTKGYFGTTKQMRAEEYLLTENKKLYIYGKGTWQKASAFGLSCDEDKVLVFEVTRATGLSVFDFGADAVV